LPFLFPGKGKPVERFAITDGIYWSYVGREYFTTLLNEVTQLMGSGTRKFSLHETIGYGKSYLLAALVSYLTVNGTRVVYIPDCRECCEEPLTYFQASMLFTWADDRSYYEAEVDGRYLSKTSGTSCLSSIRQMPWMWRRKMAIQYPTIGRKMCVSG
jgi:hypothetical protein